jgi:predicted dehydrogenase
MKDHWMSDRSVSGGGSFMDTGCHSLDLFIHLIGWARVDFGIFHWAWKGRAESSATVLVHGARVAGVIQSSWTEPARFTVAVVGLLGSLSYDYDTPGQLLLRRSDGSQESIAVESHEVRFQRQLEAFADLASGREPDVAAATFAEGLEVAQCVEEAQRYAFMLK